MNKWYQEENGSTSAMRIMAVPGAMVGLAISVAGVVGLFLGVSEAIAASGIGTTLFTIATGVKLWQKEKEK